MFYHMFIISWKKRGSGAVGNLINGSTLVENISTIELEEKGKRGDIK